jgi:hypothetical protein
MHRSKLSVNLKSIFRRSLSSGTSSLKKTSFYDLHLSLGGKMVPFAGYELPVQYEGIDN